MNLKPAGPLSDLATRKRQGHVPGRGPRSTSTSRFGEAVGPGRTAATGHDTALSGVNSAWKGSVGPLASPAEQQHDHFRVAVSGRPSDTRSLVYSMESSSGSRRSLRLLRRVLQV